MKVNLKALLLEIKKRGGYRDRNTHISIAACCHAVSVSSASNCYSTVAVGIFTVSAGSCRTI